MSSALPRTLSELLDREHPPMARYIAVDRDGSHRSLTFAELAEKSRIHARSLQSESALSAGNALPIVLSIADPLDFAVAFFAVARAGHVPVPAPDNPTENRGHRKRLFSILEASRPAAAIVSPAVRDTAHEACRPYAIPVLTVSEVDSGGVAGPASPVADATAAYVQYTSGSISRPKPITIGQQHLMAQLTQAAEAFRENRNSVSVNWVPLFHDMGLITSLLRPLWSGYTSVLLRPSDFVRAPKLWPAAMTTWSATHTSSPDFGYALCAAKVGDTAQFDLRSLRVARNAGEAVRWRTIENFTATFRPAGFRRSAFKPSYGLAEATLTVTTCGYQDSPRVVLVSALNLRQGRATDPVHDGDQVRLVSSGRPLAGTTVTVVNPDGTAAGTGVVGEVVVSGPQVATGRVRTGDLGFLWQDELVLLGRSHERFQIRGENYYSGEIEHFLSANEPAVRSGRVAALLADRPGDDSPEFAVIAELRDHETADDTELVRIRRRLTQLASEHFGLSVKRVILVPARTLPITTSGKIRREDCRVLLNGMAAAPTETRTVQDEHADRQ